MPPAGPRPLAAAAAALAPVAAASRRRRRSARRPRGSPLVLVAVAARRLVGQLHRGQRDLHDVELVGERLDDDAEALQVVGCSRLSCSAGPGQLQPAGAQVGDRRHLLDRDLLLGEPLDALSMPVLARLGQRDRDALAPGAADAADAVHVRLGRRRHVVVDDVGELVDVEAAGGDVGGDEQVGGAGAQPAHHPVALLLAHAAVQRLGAVAAAVERLGELVDLVAGAAEDDRRGRAPRRRGSGRARPACARAARRRRVWRTSGASPAAARLAADLDPDRVVQVAAGDARRSAAASSPRTAPSGGSAGVSPRIASMSSAKPMSSISSASSSTTTCSARRGAACRGAMWSSARPGVATTTSTPRSQRAAAGGRSAGRRRSAAPGRRARGRTGGSPRRPASASSRVGTSTSAVGRRAAAARRRAAAGAAARTPRSCRCRWPPGRAGRGPRAAAGSPRAGSASAPRSRGSASACEQLGAQAEVGEGGARLGGGHRPILPARGYSG